MNILIVGDICSKLGRESLETNLKQIRSQKTINFVIVNGENISHGKGMNYNHYKWLLSLGVNVITMGNHTYNNKQIYKVMEEATNVVRPYNYPDDSAGIGYVTVNYNGIKITIMQMIGNVFMPEGNKSVFTATEELLSKVESDIYICDFHGEATSEKIAYGYYFDGRIQVIFGTHTHVATRDARILPKGTAYITDIGMTGPLDGVIGTKKEIIINRFINDGKDMFQPEDEGRKQFNAIFLEIDEKQRKVTFFDTINIVE